MCILYHKITYIPKYIAIVIFIPVLLLCVIAHIYLMVLIFSDVHFIYTKQFITQCIIYSCFCPIVSTQSVYDYMMCMHNTNYNTYPF